MIKLKQDCRITSNVDDLFANVEDLVKINGILLKNLELKLNKWNNETTTIGQVFLDVVRIFLIFFEISKNFLKGPYLKPYYVKYTENYAKSISQLKELEKLPSFIEWQEVLKKNSKKIQKKINILEK